MALQSAATALRGRGTAELGVPRSVKKDLLARHMRRYWEYTVDGDSAMLEF